MFSITVIGSEQLFSASQFEFYRANSQQYNISKRFALLGNDPAILEGLVFEVFAHSLAPVSKHLVTVEMKNLKGEYVGKFSLKTPEFNKSKP